MASKSKVTHPFHILPPSIMPLLTAFSACILAIGAIFYMHYEVHWLLITGFTLLLLSVAYWFRDIIHEAVVEKAHSKIVRLGFRQGMLLFIFSEVMFFVAFFWAFFNASLDPVGGVWPPKGIETFNPFELPFLMTLILLLSGTTVTWAHQALLEGKMEDASRALLITVFLGIFFTTVQLFEYSHATFGFTDGIFASTFYMATGFHGFHVIIGTIFLFICYIRTKKGHFTPQSHFGFEAAAWYWHFVDVIWLFLFVSIYWWGS